MPNVSLPATTPRRRTLATLLAAPLAALLVGACEQPTVPYFNNPSENEFSSISSLSQVQALATGVLAGDRGSAGTQIMYAETMGRDIYRVDNAEPRYITELLGTSVDPSNFLGTSVWPYSTIRLADVMIKGTAAAPAGVLTDAAKKAAQGYAQTFKALEYMRAIEMRDSLGVPFGTDLPSDQLAAIRCKPAVLDGIASILDSAAAALTAGGASFPFALPAGFTGFTTPATFLTINRALAAKVDVYRAFRDYARSKTIDRAALDSANAALAKSFLTMAADKLELGPVHLYSTATGDAVNPLYQDPASTIFRANPRVVSEAEPGDQRVARATAAGSTKSLSGVGSSVILTVYGNNTAPIPIIMNRELILLRAEARWGLGDLAGAMQDVNFIRQSDAGLPALTLGSADAVLTQILREKRYSLLFRSPARWIDARLFGRLTGEPPVGLGKERGNDPIAAFPIPSTEASARNGVTACTA